MKAYITVFGNSLGTVHETLEGAISVTETSNLEKMDVIEIDIDIETQKTYMTKGNEKYLEFKQYNNMKKDFDRIN